MGTGASKHNSSTYTRPEEPTKLSASTKPEEANKLVDDKNELPLLKTTSLVPVVESTFEKKNILTEQVEYLQKCTDYATPDVFRALTEINQTYSITSGDEERQPLGDHLAEIRYANVFVKIWKELMKEDLILNSAHSMAVKVYKKLKGATHNFSDVSQDLCGELGKSGAVALLLSELKHPELNYKHIDDEGVNSGKRRQWIKSTLGILHNTIRMCSDNVPIFREAGAVELLTEYLKCTYMIVRAKALLNLVYIVNEDENDKIMTGGTNISFLVKMLESSLEYDDHMSRSYYFDAEELVDGLNKLAQNDANKMTMVRCGVLPLLVKLMKENKNEEEMRLAGRCIWTLAFSENNKEKIRNEPQLMEELMKHMHCKHPAKCRGSCKTIRGALWILGEESMVKESEQLESISANNGQSLESVEKSVGHVMISYQWDAQKTLIKVKDRLKARGYKIWMDIEQMEGSTLEAMASAVEHASVVLICYSQRYKDSPSCRTEAEYTYRLQKPVIPLRIQNNYQPDGWLGILLGAKLYFDFSSGNKLEQEMPKLFKELGERGLQSSAPEFQKRHSTVLGLVAPEVGSAPQGAVPVTGTAQWTNSDVSNWFDGIGLSHLKKRFTDYNGEMIMGLRLVASESPDFFYSSLKSDLGFKKLIDIIRFRSALEKLS